MKKKICAVLGLVMIIGCMTGCGNSAKEVTTQVKEETAGDEVYTTDDYSISYSKNDFELLDVRGSIELSYCNKNVKTAGANMIIITKEEKTTVDEIVKAIVGEGFMDSVTDGTLGAEEIPVKVYTIPTKDNENLFDTVMVMQSGDDVIMLETIRTVGTDDEAEMTVEGAFTHSIESFVLN